MKKVILFALVVLSWTSCGNKTGGTTPETDSAQVQEITDTVSTVNAITGQVKAVFDYLNELRQHPNDKRPSVDERFGTKEWQQVRADAKAVDMACECGGFFDFGENGPLDAWVYDCYEGQVSADSIKVNIQPNGTADVSLYVKNTPDAKGVPVRWLMRMEDGQWRVNDIIFVQDDNLNLLNGMRAYADDGKYNTTFTIGKYLTEMKKQAAKLYDKNEDDIYFVGYGLLDIDRDGIPEVSIRCEEPEATVVFSIAGEKPSVLADSFGASEIYYFEHGVGAQGGCGTGCMMGSYAILKNSLPTVRFRSYEQYDMNGNLDSSENTIDEKESTPEEVEKLMKKLGESLDIVPVMHEIEN